MADLEHFSDERGPRKASTGKYWSKRYRTDHRIYIQGGFYSTDLTALDEHAAPKLNFLPLDLAQPLRDQFWYRLETDQTAPGDWTEKKAAMAHLGASVDELLSANVDIAYDYDEIEARAKVNAEICQRLCALRNVAPALARQAELSGNHRLWRRKLHALLRFFRALDVDPPHKTAQTTARGMLKRACSHRFWRRRLLVKYGRSAEHASRKAGLVKRERAPYVSRLAYRAFEVKSAAMQRWLSECILHSDAGDQLSLLEVHGRSVSNPAIRRNELMTRMRGFEEISQELDHVGEFITLTCPSAYHATLATGLPNPAYEGGTVRDGQEWLQTMWARARAKLQRKGVMIYGFRIAEPHHDGTPHWHMVLFTLASDRDALRDVLTEVWLSERGSDPGAQTHRIKFKAIDPAKGSAAGYLSKYIAKNIDGFEVGEDFELLDPAEAAHASPEQSPGRAETSAVNTAKRVRSWASLWGIRQFQQIGGPQVTIYRECRRLREPVSIASIEPARLAADAGEWADFIRAVGGIVAGRNGSLSLWKKITGEMNQYDETRGPQIIGISGAGGQVQTHLKIWRIQKLGSLSAPWTRVNNCTGPRGGENGPPAIGEPSAWTNPQESSMYGPN